MVLIQFLINMEQIKIKMKTKMIKVKLKLIYKLILLILLEKHQGYNQNKLDKLINKIYKIKNKIKIKMLKEEVLRKVIIQM